MGSIFSGLAYLFGYLLKFWLNICGNYGIAVLLFSISIKAILFPLSLKQQKSMKQNQELQPKLNELQQKYGNNQEQMAIEYQKFMKENKFNPFGGCLLAIFQIVALFGVLYVVTNPIKYMDKCSDEEIKVAFEESILNQDFSGDSKAFESAILDYHYKDTSGDKKTLSGDSLQLAKEEYLEAYRKSSRYYELKILKDKYDLNLFGIDLGTTTAENPTDLRLWIFPVLTTVFYYISLLMVSGKQKQVTKMKDANGEEIEMPNMMMMNIFMPIMSGFISYSVPQSMGLYWFINSFIQVIIQFVSDKIINKKEKKDSNVLDPIDPIKDDDLESEQKVISDSSSNNSNHKNKKKKKK